MNHDIFTYTDCRKKNGHWVLVDYKGRDPKLVVWIDVLARRVPFGSKVVSNCGFSRCINPKHLELKWPPSPPIMRRIGKITDKERIKAVKLASEVGTKEAARVFKVQQQTIRRWVARYVFVL